MTSLPAYIANRQRDPNALSLAQRGLQNVGSGQGPYLSIEGGRFTLVDAAGGKMPIQTLYIDVCIIDINDHLSKEYRPKEDVWDPNNPTPPLCWSDNGLAPSSQVSPSGAQSLTCELCPHQEWGSKISLKGNEVQACRDIQKVAVIVPGMPNNIFRLTIPPNSFKLGWRPYLAKFQNAGFDLVDVVTRITFKQGETGTLEFNPAPSPWLDDATVQVRDKALAAKASDMIVGRLDRPRQGALAAPAIVTQGEVQRPLPAPQPTLFGTTQETPASAVSQSAALTPQAEPQRRRRRTQAEIAATNQQPQGGVVQQAPQPQMAPFRPEASSGQANGPAGPAFGVGQGVAPNPELQSAINSIFGS